MAGGPLPNSSAVDRAVKKKKVTRVRREISSWAEQKKKTYHTELAGIFPSRLKSKGRTR